MDTRSKRGRTDAAADVAEAAATAAQGGAAPCQLFVSPHMPLQFRVRVSRDPSRPPDADCAPQKEHEFLPPPVVGHHFPAVQKARKAYAMPTIFESADKLGVNMELKGITHVPVADQFQFPDDGTRVLQLPITILVENGRWLVINSVSDILNTGARKFDPETGCACVYGVNDGARGAFCTTCAAAPVLMVHDPSQPEAEWRPLSECGYGVTNRAQASDVVLALLAGALPPWAAPGRQKIVQFCGTKAPTGVLGNKNVYPSKGGWTMHFSCTFPGTGATTDGNTMVCGAGWAVSARPGVEDKVFVEPWPGIPHRHDGSPCYEHEIRHCMDPECLRKLPPPLPPSATLDGLHGASTLEKARNVLARTGGRTRDQPVQLAAQITLMADPVARLLNNSFYFSSLRCTEDLCKAIKGRRFLEFGVLPPEPGSLPRVEPEHWADQLVRGRHCVCDADRVLPPATTYC